MARLRVLLIADDDDVAARVLRELTGRGYDPELAFVDSGAALDEALAQGEWDVVVADYATRAFGAPAALAAIKAEGYDLPFLIVAAAEDERAAAAAMEAGAHDYVLKGNLTRLVPAIERELREAQERAERRRSEEALRQSEERFRTVIDASIDAMLATTLDGTVTLFNRAAREMFAFRRADAAGVPFVSLFAEQSREDVAFFVASHVAASPPRKAAGDILEVAALCADGRTLPVEMTLSLGRRADEHFLLAILRDVSARKRAEEILRETEAQLRLSQKMDAIGRLAGGVAHDFNNLLGAIVGYSDVIMQELRAADPLRRDVEEISRAARRAAELTKQLLAFSRKQVLQPRVINLNEVIRGAEGMLRRVIGEDVRLEVRLADDLGNVRADPGQIEQVILNLVINARDAMPDGGRLVLETANHEVSGSGAPAAASASRDAVRLSVADDGCGMDNDTLARIFEPFYTTKEKGRGTGLGLSLVYGIVEQSGGSVRARSALGEGTTFDVVLPRVYEAVAGSSVPGHPLGQQPGGSETVLVVEDEEVLRVLISRMLRLCGYHVLTAADGSEALAVCERNRRRIHLLLTDIVMPYVNGRELADRLAASDPEVKVLFMTGYAGDGDAREVGRGVEVIPKPFTANALAAKVRKTLDAAGGQLTAAVRRSE